MSSKSDQGLESYRLTTYIHAKNVFFPTLIGRPSLARSTNLWINRFVMPYFSRRKQTQSFKYIIMNSLYVYCALNK